MRIERAVPGDERAILAIASSVRITPDLCSSAGRTGFLVNVISERDYLSRILASPHFLAARDETGVAAFLMAYDGRTLERLKQEIPQEDQVIEKVLSRGVEDLLFIDQIAVRPDRQGAGLAQRLYEELSVSCPAPRHAGSILHEPVRNVRSLGFFVGRHGWRLVEEVRQGVFLWGIYEGCCRPRSAA